MSCYEEFEIRVALSGILKVDVLKGICHKIDNYYFFISEDGVFNWFDLEGNHVEEPGILKELKCEYIPISITKCVIPNSVTYIGIDAFYNCYSLEEITIPDSVTYIDKGAFAFCESLKEITIPGSVTGIGIDAFYNCYSLEEITIPDSVTSIGDDAFWLCELYATLKTQHLLTSSFWLSRRHCCLEQRS